MSVPNQSSFLIVKPNAAPPFLQINEDDWRTASQKLTYKAFLVYLYLAQNSNGYCFEYSPTAIEKLGLMNKSTATKVRQELEREGYIENGCFYVESLTKRRQRADVARQIQEFDIATDEF